jgi:hypothetical protein
LTSSNVFSQRVDTVAIGRFSVNENVLLFQEPVTHLTVSIRSIVCDSINMRAVVTNTTNRSIGILRSSTLERSFNKDRCYYLLGFNPNDLFEITHTYVALTMYEIPVGDSLVLDIESGHCDFFDFSLTFCRDVEKLKASLKKKNMLYEDIVREQKKVLQIGELIERDTNFGSIEFEGITRKAKEVKVVTYLD